MALTRVLTDRVITEAVIVRCALHCKRATLMRPLIQLYLIFQTLMLGILTMTEVRETVSGVFVLAGWEPNSELLNGIAELDAEGYVLAGEDTVSSADGVFTAGDVRAKPVRRPTTAVADGAVAAQMAGLYVRGDARTGGKR